MRFSHGKALWLLPLSLFLFSFASPAHAQFWKKKSYLHWSASECRRILTNSPWAQSHSFSKSYMPNGVQDSQTAAIPVTTGEAKPPPPGRQQLAEVTFTAQFFSAMPVREAQVRLKQLQMHYNRMTSAQKKAFDESAARFLGLPYPKYTVVRVSYSTNVQAYLPAIYAYWQKQTTATLRTTAYFSVNGKTVSLAKYHLSPPQDQEFFLFFPRQVNNEPVLDPEQKSLTLVVTNSTITFTNSFGNGNPVAEPPRAGNLQFSFDVKKMVFHGKVAY